MYNTKVFLGRPVKLASQPTSISYQLSLYPKVLVIAIVSNPYTPIITTVKSLYTYTLEGLASQPIGSVYSPYSNKLPPNSVLIFNDIPTPIQFNYYGVTAREVGVVIRKPVLRLPEGRDKSGVSHR